MMMVVNETINTIGRSKGIPRRLGHRRDMLNPFWDALCDRILQLPTEETFRSATTCVYNHCYRPSLRALGLPNCQLCQLCLCYPILATVVVRTAAAGLRVYFGRAIRVRQLPYRNSIVPPSSHATGGWYSFVSFVYVPSSTTSP